MYKIIFGIIGVVLIGVAYYGVSPLLMNTRVDEVAPQTKTEKPEQIVVTAPVIGTNGHPGSGTVQVIKTERGDVVRYENFKTINGPDLYVYLAKDLGAKSFISLGELKATEGNVNYDVPPGVDVSDYKYVMVWCKQFGVLFNYVDFSLAR